MALYRQSLPKYQRKVTEDYECLPGNFSPVTAGSVRLCQLFC